MNWILEKAKGSLNAFPLFEILLRIKEPSRLPGTSTRHLHKPVLIVLFLAGIQFELVAVSSTQFANATKRRDADSATASYSSVQTNISHALYLKVRILRRMYYSS